MENPTDEAVGIGDAYQRATKYQRRPGHLAPRPRAAAAEGSEALPPPQTAGGRGLWDVIQARRSVREFRREALSREQLAQLLWATQGVTARQHGHAFRAAPSAGACYPIDTYVAVHRVEGLAAGLYRYEVDPAALTRLRFGDLSDAIASACLEQDMAGEAAVVFAWAAVPARSKQRYRQRAYRYIYMDAGHIGQNLHLAAVAMGLGCCAIGAFFDDEVNTILGLDGQEATAVYLSAVGVPA